MSNQQATLIAPPVPSEMDVPLSEIELPPVPVRGPLRDSILEHGLLQPVILERSKKGYQVAAGRHRVVASHAAGLETVRALVFKAGEINPALIALIENSMRRSNPAVEFDSIVELFSAGKTESEVAAATGMPVSTIRSRMKMQDLHPAILAAVRAGKVSVVTAETAARLPAKAQDRLAGRLQRGERITVRDARAEATAARQTAAEDLPATLFEMPELPPPTWRDVAREKIIELVSDVRMEGGVEDQHDTTKFATEIVALAATWGIKIGPDVR